MDRSNGKWDLIQKLLNEYQSNNEKGIVESRLEKPYPPVDLTSVDDQLPELSREGSNYGGSSGRNYRLHELYGDGTQTPLKEGFAGEPSQEQLKQWATDEILKAYRNRKDFGE